ncbi:MAG: hypothetical protein GF411_12840 [Candidatus Lokiarchaeota archaeon]|nr:hypothetical protein [Candidatus Lokiarchaeota archaeon]
MPKKAGKSKSLLALVFILIITNAATVYYFMFYQPSVPAENVPQGLEDITENPTSHIGEILTLEGYYVKSNDFHLLISNPAAYVNNSLNPSNYVIMTGNVPDSMADHIGERVSVKGEIGWGDESDLVLSIDFSELIATSSKDYYPGVYDDSIQNASTLGDLDLFQLDPDATKYAVLYSGGIKPEKAYYDRSNFQPHFSA